MNSIGRDSALQALEAAAETTAPVSLLVAHMSISCTGKLRRVSEEGGVVIELSGAPAEPILAGDRCAVTFPMAGHSAGFTSHALGTSDGGGGRVFVTLDLPGAIQPSEQRMSVRVPVPLGALGVAIVGGDAPLLVRPIDISLDGILIELDDDQDATLELGGRFTLELERHDMVVAVEGEVRRQQHRRFGILFMYEGARPREITKIVAELQHLWNEV